MRHYSRRTEKPYIGWIRRFILFHGRRHSAELGEREVSAFLSALATTRRVSASTHVVLAVAVLLFAQPSEAQYPTPVEGTFTLKEFEFRSGERLPELRLYYPTLGRPERDAQGIVRNAVLMMHGTGGSGASFIRPEFAGELFGPGGLLDAARYFLILPDGIGHGRSSKPRVMDCAGAFPGTATLTWWRRSIGW